MIALPVIFALVGLMMLLIEPKTSPPDPVVKPLGGVIVAASMLSFAWLRRYRLVADARGLTWHTFSNKGACTWSEVQDYYIVPKPKQETVRVMETTHGAVRVRRSAWTQREQFERFVQRETALRLGFDWEVKGARERENFPIVFRYDAKKAQGEFVFSIFLLIVLFGLLGLFLLVKLPRYAHEVGVSWAVGLGFTMFSVFGIYLLGSGLGLWLARDTLRRRNETLTIDADGITFSDGTQATRIDWNQATACRMEGKGLVKNVMRVESADASIVFTTQIGNDRTLNAILGARLPKPVVRAAESDAADDLASAFSYASDGSRLYHYRTRSVRALAIFPFVFAAMLLITPLLRPADSVKSDALGEGIMYGVGVLLAAFGMYLLWRMRTGGIRTSRDGITQRTLRGERFLSWNHIEDYSCSDFVFHVVGNGVHLRISEFISRRAELMEEIREKARQCNGQKWERRSPRKNRT